jgi:hypothetical protein
MALNTGDRSRARLWSPAIYLAYPEAEGLWYVSAMNAHAPAVTLYERAADALAERRPSTGHSPARSCADSWFRLLGLSTTASARDR